MAQIRRGHRAQSGRLRHEGQLRLNRRNRRHDGLRRQTHRNVAANLTKFHFFKMTEEEKKIDHLETIVCALTRCGTMEAEDLYPLAKNGYLDAAIQIISEQYGATLDFNTLVDEGCRVAYEELFNYDANEDLDIYTNYSDTHVYCRTEYLDFKAMDSTFTDGTGYRLELMDAAKPTKGLVLFNHFKEWLLDEAEGYEVESDPEEGLIVNGIDQEDFSDFLTYKFDVFTEGKDCSNEAIEEVMSYLTTFDYDGLKEELRTIAIESDKEGLERKKTEDELNHTYR